VALVGDILADPMCKVLPEAGHEDVNMRMTFKDLTSSNFVDIRKPSWFEEYASDPLLNKEVQEVKNIAEQVSLECSMKGAYTSMPTAIAQNNVLTSIEATDPPEPCWTPTSAECLMGRAGCRERLLTDHSAADSCEHSCWKSVGCDGSLRTSQPTQEAKDAEEHGGSIFAVRPNEDPRELEEHDVRATIALWTLLGVGMWRIVQLGWQLSCAVAAQCGYRSTRTSRPTGRPSATAASTSATSRESVTAPQRQSVRQRALTPFRVGRQTPYVCECGFRLEAREVTSETSPHFGRLYVSRQRSRADPQRCNYFKWL
jgi:hypothetical protein